MKNCSARSTTAVIIDAIEGAFWTAIVSGAVAAPIGFALTMMIATANGGEPVDGEYSGWLMFGVYFLVGLAAIVGAVCGAIITIVHPARLAPWFLAGIIVLPAACAALVYALLSRRNDCVVRYTRIGALLILALLSALSVLIMPLYFWWISR